MDDSRISVRYAKALFMSAEEKKIVDVIYNEVSDLFKLIKEVELFNFFMHDPLLKSSNKKQAIDQMFGGKYHKTTVDFLKLLVNNKREAYLEDIARNFIDIYRLNKNIKFAVLTTAIKINNETKNKIIKVIENIFNAKIELNEKVKNDIIGGFVLQVGDKQLDASIANNLKEIRKTLKSNI